VLCTAEAGGASKGSRSAQESSAAASFQFFPVPECPPIVNLPYNIVKCTYILFPTLLTPPCLDEGRYDDDERISR
jgi:hypothetical protein